MKILHLAGLHVDGSFENEIYLDSLIERFESDYARGKRIDLILISGGIVLVPTKKNYETVFVWLQKIAAAWSLTNENIFIVPGINDYKMPDENSQSAPKLLRVYLEFVEEYFPHLSSQERKEITPFLKRFSDDKLIIIGLNLFSTESNLRLPQISEEILPLLLTCYPIEFISMDIKKQIEKWSSRAVILGAGLEFSLYKDYITNLQTGEIHPVEETAKGRFQILNIDSRERNLVIEFFSFNRRNGRWNISGEEGKDGVKIINL